MPMQASDPSISHQCTHSLVAKSPNRHLAFPDVCLLSSGVILVVYREGQHHVDVSGRIMLCRGTASKENVAFDEPACVCNSGLDDRDPSIVQLRDGSIWINFFRFEPKTRKAQLAIIRSVDEGRTWNTHQDLDVSGFSSSGLACSDGILELPAGDLLLPAYGTADSGEAGAYVLRSQDQGTSWSGPIPLAVLESPNFEEPALGYLNDGRMVALLRTDHKGKGYIYQSVSVDQGYTWSTPEELSLWGYPADLLPLSDGRLLVTYGYRQLPCGVRYCLTDRSLMWSIQSERILRCDGDDDGELGYPSSIELDSGEVLTVYYHTSREGGLPYIACSRFQLPEKEDSSEYF
jgi:hypothetical protein